MQVVIGTKQNGLNIEPWAGLGECSLITLNYLWHRRDGYNQRMDVYRVNYLLELASTHHQAHLVVSNSTC
jgi:hypothetical protein